MKKSYYLFAILFFSSCGSGSDPISTAKKHLDDVCERKSKGYLKVANFIKKDAIKEIRNGVDYYILNYDFELVGTKDGGYLLPASHSGNGEISNIWDLRISDEPVSIEISFSNGKQTYPKLQVKKGHRYRLSGAYRLGETSGFKMTLAKYENGWVKVEDEEEL